MIEWPKDAAEATLLQVRLQVLDHCAPSGASDLITDAIKRGDKAFLQIALMCLDGWVGRRNAWSTPEARLRYDEIRQAAWTVLNAPRRRGDTL